MALLAQCISVLSVMWRIQAELAAPIRCEIAILGTGISGAYAAYILAPCYQADLCVIERHNHDGGRILDVAEQPGGPKWGLGALRIMGEHVNMRHLAQRLNITLELGMGTEYVRTPDGEYFRDMYGNTTGADAGCVVLQGAQLVGAPDTCWTDGQLVKAIVAYARQHPQAVERYPDLLDFVRTLVGQEGLGFLHAFSRFNSYFAQSHATRPMIDFLEHECEGEDARLFYTVGGMSTFVTRMMAEVGKTAARAFHGQPILQMDTNLTDAGAPFTLVTPGHTFVADEVISSIDPFNWKLIKGNVPVALWKTRQMQAMLSHVAVTVTAWWGERWWERVPINGSAGRLTRYINHDVCLNSLDFPSSPDGIAQNVSRVVYDDGACLAEWRTLIKGSGEQDTRDTYLREALDGSDPLFARVMHYLRRAFPRVAIPDPRRMIGMLRENNWHWHRVGSLFSDADMRRWAPAPLAPKRLALVGDPYNPRHVWCDGSLKTVMAFLTARYGIAYPCVDAAGQPEYRTPSKDCTPPANHDPPPSGLHSY